ncbi:MAG: hypothetical protein OXG92_00395 [Chloroflexi bacterium]|nr:hypothetical protein [Chloroflexota bacterium]MCY3582496.1 hypothetical protein [Chloroflexota bacterium]MCY3714914.1 hypothetical protein [Chloroflexota bacterium]MDE2650053.1 hypothetical protein [Chloroflexota bacterium]MXX50133.1 hypothetical protein [Chloroflexota bacterium]
MAGRRNAFIRGLGGMFSWVDVLNRRLLAETPAEADAEALREDWETVGNLMYDALGMYGCVYKVYPAKQDAISWKTTTKNGK